MPSPSPIPVESRRAAWDRLWEGLLEEPDADVIGCFTISDDPNKPNVPAEQVNDTEEAA